MSEALLRRQPQQAAAAKAKNGGGSRSAFKYTNYSELILLLVWLEAKPPDGGAGLDHILVRLTVVILAVIMMPKDLYKFSLDNHDYPWEAIEKEKKEKEFVCEEKRERDKFLRFLRQDKPLFGLPLLLVSRVFFWTNHAFGLYGLYLLLTGTFAWKVLLFQFCYSYCSSLGTTIGAHRLWTHKSFKAKLPLKIILMMAQSITAQLSLYKWCLDHRVHHKFTDTHKDPHNSKRGFWFSQMFWVISPRHPEHQEALEKFDMPDLERDPVILFQSKWYPWLVYIFYVFIPVNVSVYFFGVTRGYAHCLNCLRWSYNTHISSAVNSFAHIWGTKPYDASITASDNKIVSLFSVGEGWHNYHHTFPWDYKASELGWKINFSTMVIDFFAWIGWAYDLKTVNHEMLADRLRRTGDGTHPLSIKNETQNENQVNVNESSQQHVGVDSIETWGWGDENVSDEFRKMTVILKPDQRRLASGELYNEIYSMRERDR